MGIVKMQDGAPILYDSHTHTTLCRHATGELSEYARVAEQRGLKGIIFTCHNPLDAGMEWASKWRMRLDELPCYLDKVSRTRDKFLGRVDVRLGLESDYAPGMESWLEKLHRKAPFGYVLGSVHPQIDEYRNRYWKNDALEYQRVYFDHLAMSAETGLFDALSHPDLIKAFFATHWKIGVIMPDVLKALDRIAKAGTAMELNTSGLLKATAEMHPGREILEQIHARNIPVVLGSDAHSPQRVGADFEPALKMLHETGFARISVFLERKRREIQIDAALDSLKQTVPHNASV